MKITPTNGFTLIELLIAITILAILAAMAYGGLNSVLKSHEILNKQQENFNQLNQIISQLEKEIRDIVPRPIHDKYNTLLPALKLDSNNGVVFSFTRAGVPNPSGLQKNPLQRIDYLFSNQSLKKRLWLTVDNNNAEDYVTSTLATDVTQFKIELLGYDGNFYQQWPANQNDAPDILPKAIKFSLKSKESAEINRLVELPL